MKTLWSNAKDLFVEAMLLLLLGSAIGVGFGIAYALSMRAMFSF